MSGTSRRGISSENFQFFAKASDIVSRHFALYRVCVCARARVCMCVYFTQQLHRDRSVTARDSSRVSRVSAGRSASFACAFADVRDATAVRRNTRRCAATCTAPMSARSRAGRASLAAETRVADVSPISPTAELHVGYETRISELG